MTSRILYGVMAAAFLSVSPYDASACGYHGAMGDGLSAQYPGSIEVAIALREAADAGVIDGRSLAPKKTDLFGYHRTVQRLYRMRNHIGRRDLEGMPSFSLLLVETALWSRFTTEGQIVSVAAHTDGPQPGEPVVITGEAVIAAIDAGKLAWGDALERNLIIVIPK